MSNLQSASAKATTPPWVGSLTAADFEIPAPRTEIAQAATAVATVMLDMTVMPDVVPVEPTDLDGEIVKHDSLMLSAADW